MSRHIEFDQKNEVFEHYQQLDTRFYKTHSTGDLMNRISEDERRVRMYTGPALMYFINLAAVTGFRIFFMMGCRALRHDPPIRGQFRCLRLLSIVAQAPGHQPIHAVDAP